MYIQMYLNTDRNILPSKYKHLEHWKDGENIEGTVSEPVWMKLKFER